MREKQRERDDAERTNEQDTWKRQEAKIYESEKSGMGMKNWKLEKISLKENLALKTENWMNI